MHVRLTPELKEYMAKKNYRHIEIELVDSGTSTCGFAEVAGKFLTDEQAAAIQAKSRHVLDTELGHVYCTAVFEFDEEPVLGIKSFFGLKDITISGIHGWRW